MTILTKWQWREKKTRTLAPWDCHLLVALRMLMMRSIPRSNGVVPDEGSMTDETACALSGDIFERIRAFFFLLSSSAFEIRLMLGNPRGRSYAQLKFVWSWLCHAVRSKFLIFSIIFSQRTSVDAIMSTRNVRSLRKSSYSRCWNHYQCLQYMQAKVHLIFDLRITRIKCHVRWSNFFLLLNN